MHRRMNEVFKDMNSGLKVVPKAEPVIQSKDEYSDRILEPKIALMKESNNSEPQLLEAPPMALTDT